MVAIQYSEAQLQSVIMNNPTVSIITVNLNNAEGLEKTIHSVVKQNYSSIEYIIIDGGSTDNSKSIIDNYSQNIYLSISEPDNGVYHAMNKGINKANGNYLLFLNSGDTLIGDDAIQSLIDGGDNTDLIYGNLLMQNNTENRECIFPDELSFKFFFINSLPHPCTLINSSLFSKVGKYREDFKIASDWAFFIQAVCLHNCSYKHINKAIAVFHLGGLSSTHTEVIQKERQTIMNEYFPCFEKDYIELFRVEAELKKVRSTLGFRIHQKIKNLFR